MLPPKVFSSLYVSMVTAGEASGQMDIILVRLAEYVESTEELKREIRSAMTYPVISMVLVLSITGFLMIGVVPGFKEVFDGLGAELPALTKNVLALSDWLRERWYVLLAGMFASAIGIILFKRTERGALVIDHMALRVPGLRRAGQEGRSGALLAYLRDADSFRRADHGHAGDCRRYGRQPRDLECRAQVHAKACAMATCSPTRSGEFEGLPSHGGQDDRHR